MNKINKKNSLIQQICKLHYNYKYLLYKYVITYIAEIYK